jgi:hypothetical protein
VVLLFNSHLVFMTKPAPTRDSTHKDELHSSQISALLTLDFLVEYKCNSADSCLAKREMMIYEIQISENQ